MRHVSIAVLFTICLSRGGAAQARDAGARMQRVASGIYAIIHDDATDEWPHGNTGVIVGDDGVFVVDATYLPSRARADIALIKSVTDKPSAISPTLTGTSTITTAASRTARPGLASRS